MTTAHGGDAAIPGPGTPAPGTPAPGTIALNGIQTLAVRTAFMRTPEPPGPRSWQSISPDDRTRHNVRTALLSAALATVVMSGISWAWSGYWTPALLLAFPVVFVLVLWRGHQSPVAPDHAVIPVEVTVAPDRLRVVNDGALRIDCAWQEVAVWAFFEWEPPHMYGTPEPPELRELRLSGPDARVVTLDTFMFTDRAALDAICLYLCRHERIVLDARTWTMPR
jgi:hypothetical protein